MAFTFSIYQLACDGADWTLTQAVSVPADKVLRGTYSTYSVVSFASVTLLAAYSKAQGQIDLYRLQESQPWIIYSNTLEVGPGWDQLNGFTFSNTAYLMAYRADTGQFGFYSLDGELRLEATYLFSRTHAPAVSKGFTTVRPFVLANGLVFLGYAFETGAVCMYGLTGVVSSPASAPPVLANAIWDHVWAPGWTRFAFFNLGGEVFFLKTNTKYPNVNIDHVLDVPANGTIEVATRMDLTDAQALTFVDSFAMDNGHPHFIAYRPDGLTTVYRIHSDCTGWTSLVSVDAPPNASTVLPGAARNQRQQFIYLSED
ncbi:MAG: hypothetical protein WA993_02890 [Candidatus Binatus sp.]